MSPKNKPKAPRAILFKNHQWLHEFPMLKKNSRDGVRCDDFQDQPSPEDFPWNPVQPVIDEGAVYLSNGVFVRALELYSKAEKWQFRGWVNVSQARQNRVLNPPLALHDNTIFAALETPRPRERRIWTFVPQQQIPHRQLVALDASTGKVKWQHYRWRGKTFEDTEFVSKLNINSEPLIIGDRLFVAASKFHTSYHQYLCCFDKNNGDLLWATFISTGQMEQNMFGNRVREAVSGQLVEKDGYIYHCTNIGVIASVDARLGTLKFTATYPQIQIPRQTRFDTRIHERAPAWNNNKPIVAGENIYFTPMDCQYMMVMNGRTGKLTRCREVKRTAANRYRYLIGASGDWIIAAGAKVCFYNTATGQALKPSYIFSQPKRGYSTRNVGIVAKPIIYDGKMIAPVASKSTRRLLIWSIEDQRIIDEVTFPSNPNTPYLGNLAEKDGVFVSAATNPNGKLTYIRSYFDKQRVKRLLAAEIAARPQEPKVHFRMGEFSLQGNDKDYKSALGSFESARRLAEQQGVAGQVWADKSRNALSRLYLELAKNPLQAKTKTGLSDMECYERACDIATTAEAKVDILFKILRRTYDRRDKKRFSAAFDRIKSEYATTPYDYDMQWRSELPEAERRRYSRAGFLASAIAASFAETTGSTKKAISFYQDLISGYPEEVIGNQTSWDYGHSRIEKIIKKYGRAVYAEHDAAAKKLLEESRKQPGIKNLRILLSRYPNTEVIHEAYHEIAKRQFANEDFVAASSGVHEYFPKFEVVTARPLALLARSLERSNLKSSAYQVWTRLTKLGVHDVEEPELLEEAKAKVKELAAFAPMTRESLGSFAMKFGKDAQLEPTWTLGKANSSDDWTLVKPRGLRPAAIKSIVLVHHDRKLRAISLATKKELWAVDAHSTVSREDVMFMDSCLLVLVDGSLVCLDVTTGEELWRHDSGELRIGGFTAGQGKAYMVLEPRGFAVNFRVRALNLLSGDIVAERIIDGVAQSEAMSCGTRWLMIPLESKLACLILDGYTLANAKAWPDGVEFDDRMAPRLTADDHLVLVAPTRNFSDRELTAQDPATGRIKWRRKLGRNRATFFPGTPWTTFYKVQGPRRSSSATLMVVNNITGTATVKNSLGGFSGVRGPRLEGSSLFSFKNKFTGRQNAKILEELDTKTNSVVWRSMPFTGTRYLESFPFKEGVALRVIENLRGNRRMSRSITLYMLDRKSGRIEASIELGSRRSSNIPDVQFMEGQMVVADGPVLKVFKP